VSRNLVKYTDISKDHFFRHHGNVSVDESSRIRRNLIRLIPNFTASHFRPQEHS